MPALTSKSSTPRTLMSVALQSGTKNLMSVRGAQYANKMLTLIPKESRYSIFAQRGVFTSDIWADSALMVNAVRNGVLAQTTANWQTGHKACCAYFGRGVAPSIHPNSANPSPTDRSECCYLLTAHRFNLRGLPDSYTITNAYLSLFSPSFQRCAGIIPTPVTGAPGWPGGSFENHWSLYFNVSPTLQAPSFCYGNSWGLDTIGYQSQAYVQMGYAANGPFMPNLGRRYNLWNHRNVSTWLNGNLPILSQTGGDPVSSQVWIDVDLGVSPRNAISANRGTLWLHTGITVGNGFSAGQSGNGAYIMPGMVSFVHIGAFALKLRLNGAAF